MASPIGPSTDVNSQCVRWLSMIHASMSVNQPSTPITHFSGNPGVSQTRPTTITARPTRVQPMRRGQGFGSRRTTRVAGESSDAS